MAHSLFGAREADEVGSTAELSERRSRMKSVHMRDETIPYGARDGAVAQRAARTWSVWLALTGLSLSVLLASLGTSSANVALPTLTQAFGVSFQAAQWIVLAYLLATTALIVVVGRLGDLLGRRRLLLTGLPCSPSPRHSAPPRLPSGC